MLASKKISRGDIIQVSIDSIGFGGLGVGRYNTLQYLLEMAYLARLLIAWCSKKNQT